MAVIIMNTEAGITKMAGIKDAAIKGFKASGVHCGIKKTGRDMAVLYSAKPAVAAGAFTQNLVQAAPVVLSRQNINNSIRAIVINSGNANACTGDQGMRDAVEMAELTAAPLGVKSGEVLVFSTGVIGLPLPMDKIRQGITGAVSALEAEPGGSEAAAKAILTTDTSVKEVAYKGILPGGPFYLTGIAKGSGMICPDMATMLAFIMTDAKISRPLLGKLFMEAVENSFNMITVDGETSTNDAAVILANGASKSEEVIPGSRACEIFSSILNRACRDLALKIVGDGEGLTKIITLTIKGLADRRAGKVLARSVLNSPLVKTAFYGEDANWGRILAALGYAGVEFNPDLVDIHIGPVQVAARGCGLPFSEEKAKEVLRQREVSLVVNLNMGVESVTAWGTDLSHEYVTINSSYRS